MHVFLPSFLVEFGPVAVFLGVYVFTDFFTAIWAAIGAVVCAVAYALVQQRRIAWFPIISLASTLFFGGSSLLFHNETYFILQDTIGNIAFGAVFLWSVWRGTPILKILFQYTFAITDRGWRILTIRWAVFFLVLGCLNEFVRLTQSPETWVVFKAASTVAFVLFGVYQFRLSIKERLKKQSNWLGLRTRAITAVFDGSKK
jgi:intracellular septation protein